MVKVAAESDRAAAASVLRIVNRCDRLRARFDVGVIDFTDVTLPEETGRNQGSTLDQAIQAL